MSQLANSNAAQPDGAPSELGSDAGFGCSAPGNTYGATTAYQTARFWLLTKFAEENCMTTALDVYLELKEIAEDENRFFDEMRRYGG